MTPSSRKRRAAAAPSDIDSASNGFDAYNIHGDAKAALGVFQQASQSTIASDYNALLLQHICGDTDSSKEGRSLENLSRKMGQLKEDFCRNQGENMQSRKGRRNELIFRYNQALLLFSQGQCETAAHMCHEAIDEYVSSSIRPSEEIVTVASRMAFLWLECMLSLEQQQQAEPVFLWLDKIDSEKDPQIKFLLTLYRSRFHLSELDASGKHSDSRIRAARKELKQAMDLLQNKLRSSFGAETGSVVSSNNSEENMSTQSTVRDQYETQPPQGSVVLQKLNQSALSLKAHSEQLKGNMKKSLILCSEAHAAATPETAYEAIHANNLAVVYETNQKRHLALHALSKGLRARGEADSAFFHPDGTARPDQSLLILHNSAICAMQARHYLSAYQCMAICLARSNVLAERPRAWLRLAEACVGIFVDRKEEQGKMNDGSNVKAVVVVDGQPRGVVLDNDVFRDHPELIHEDPVEIVGSPEDLEQVKRNPLIRARVVLEKLIARKDKVDEEEFVSAQLILAYVSLAFQEYHEALNLSKQVIEYEPPSNASNATKRACSRRVATARLYAAEVSCVLGETLDAMKFLVGDGQADAIDRLAADLSGVTLEMAASSGTGKTRLARAQLTVRASASALTASMGDIAAAKQLAASAQAVEGACTSNHDLASARRALVFTLLRSGNHGPALSLLRSVP